MPLISQSKAAKLIGISRAAINKIKSRNRYFFFTDDGRVDTDSQEWDKFLKEKGYIENPDNLEQKQKGQSGYVSEKEINEIDKKKQDRLKEKQQKKEKSLSSMEFSKKNGNIHGLTGGYNPGDFHPSTPSELKSITDVIQKSLEMRIKLGEYIKRDIVEIYMNELSRTIQLTFVDLARSVSVDIAEKLNKLGLEKEIEKIIAPRVTKGIEDIKNLCLKVEKIK